jgi:hypothetical protein
VATLGCSSSPATPTATEDENGTGEDVDAPGLSVSPTGLQFAPTEVDESSFAVVTITNGGPGAERLATASVAAGPFWPTFGGTCNVTYAYVLGPHVSCTFQFGFRPATAGAHTATGSITFESGSVLSVPLSGVGTL